MALVFQRKLAIPLWAMAVLALALTAPEAGTLFLMPHTTVLAIAAVGVAVIVFMIPACARRPCQINALAEQNVAEPATGHTWGTSSLSAREAGGNWRHVR